MKAAFRCYVLQVTANAALQNTAADQALAAKLLQPLATYVAPEAPGKAVAVPAPVPATAMH